MSNGNTPAGKDSTPATDPGQAAGGASLGGTGAGTDAAGSDAQGASPSGNDFEAKVRADPEFALQQVKSWQSRADQAAQREKAWNEWAGSLAVYREQGLTGDQIAHQVGSYLELATDARRKPMLDRLLKGESVSDTSAGQEDEYLTDEERELRDLRQKVQTLETRLGETHSVQGQEALNRHLGAVAQKFKLSNEQVSGLAGDLSKQVQQWSSQGEVGRQAISNLTSSNGMKTVEIMLMQKLGFEGLSEHVRGQILKEQGTRKGLATDGPSLRLPQGADPPQEFQSTSEMLRFIEQNPEVLEREGYTS